MQIQSAKKFIVGLLIAFSLFGSTAQADRVFTLPDQRGHAGEFLQTNSVNPLWAPAGGGSVTSVAGTLPIIATPNPITTTGTISCQTATTLLPGCISAADFTTFTNKQAGIQFRDEGSNLGTSGTVTVADFVGAGVTATRVGNTLTVSIPTGGANIGDPVGGGNPYSILFIDGSGNLAEQNPGFTFNPDIPDLELDPSALSSPHGGGYLDADTLAANISYGTTPTAQVSANFANTYMFYNGGSAATNSLIQISPGFSTPTQTQFINVSPGSGAGKIELRHPVRVLATTPLLDATGVVNAATQYNRAGQFLATQDTTLRNTRYAFNAGTNISTGVDNTVLGQSAGLHLTTGNRNTFIGGLTGASVSAFSTASDNTAVGYHNGSSFTVGNENTLIGSVTSLSQIGAGARNTTLGYNAGNNLIVFAGTPTNQDNVLIGHSAGSAATDLTNLVAVGQNAGAAHTTSLGGSDGWVYVGNSAGVLDTARFNTFVGHASGANNVSGDGNTFLGYASGNQNTAGENTFLGASAGASNTSGIGQVFIGQAAGLGNQIGNRNIFIGDAAGSANIDGFDNIFIGYLTAQTFTGGGGASGNNILIGSSSDIDDAVVGSFGIGYGVHVHNSGVGAFGSDSAPISTFKFGYGDTSTTPSARVLLIPTDQDTANADQDGDLFFVSGGRGTGAGQPGTLNFETADVLPSGNTLQTEVTRVTIDHTKFRLIDQAVGVKYSQISTSAALYAVLETDFVISVTPSAGGTTVSLPASPNKGDAYIIKDVAGTAATDNITVQDGSGGTIDGSATFVISVNWGSITVYWNGVEWSII